jgi:oxygen-dependent protoporphyrinogen oxidase
LLSFPDGLEELPRALASSLSERLRVACPVRRIVRMTGGFRIEAGAETIDSRGVVVAAAAPEAAYLVGELAPAAAAALATIPYAPVAVLHLAWPRDSARLDLSGFGHLVAPARDRRILGAVWASSLFPGRAPEGQALFAVFLGGARDREAAALPEREMVAIARRDLEEELGVRGEPHVVSVTRWERAIPQYVAGHFERIAALERAERENPGLEFLGSYRGGIPVGDVVRNAATVPA